MSKLGDALRETAALVDRDDLAGVGFVQVGDWGWQIAITKSSNAESDAKNLALCLGQAANNFEPNVRRATIEELEAILQRPDNDENIEILPDGSIRASNAVRGSLDDTKPGWRLPS